MTGRRACGDRDADRRRPASTEEAAMDHSHALSRRCGCAYHRACPEIAAASSAHGSRRTCRPPCRRGFCRQTAERHCPRRFGRTAGDHDLTAHQDRLRSGRYDISTTTARFAFTETAARIRRILPGLEVEIQTRDGALYGVVGAKAPRLLTREEGGKARKPRNARISTSVFRRTKCVKRCAWAIRS